jgi:hypothetical protein
LYLVSLNPPDPRGNDSQKRGIRAGIIGQSPAGIDEVMFSDVIWAENGRGWCFGTWVVSVGGYTCILPENIRDKEEFYRAENEKRDLILI